MEKGDMFALPGLVQGGRLPWMITQGYYEEKYKVFPFSPGWPRFCYPKKDLMTQLDSYVPRASTPARAHTNTIYRDSLLPVFRGGRTGVRPARFSLLAQGLPNEHVSDGILAGLAVLTVPALVYSFVQLWSLLAGGSLNQAAC